MGRIDMDEMHDPFEDQVECARYRAERDALAQAMERVADDIERTFLGFEGADDAPAMRWAREFREALGALHSPRARHEDIEAARWVREHGGIDGLRRMFRDADSRRIELCGALGIDLDTGWNDAMAELDRRLMPEDMEWPRYEDGEPVLTGNVLLDANGEAFRATSFLFTCDWWSVKGYQGTDFCTISKDTRRELSGMPYSRRVKRPAPKVYDADGAEIREGDRVWSTQLDEPHEWIVIDPHEDRGDSQTVLVSIGDRTGHARPEDLTHRAPVLAADGEPLREGETVWSVDSGTRYTVEKITDELIPIKCRSEMGSTVSLHPSQLIHQRPVLDADGVPIREGDTVWCIGGGEAAEVAYTITADASHPDEVVLKGYEDDWPVNADKLTHTKPEIDTWQLIEEDAGCTAAKYNERRGTIFTTKQQVARDLVRRCRALAGVSE